MTRLHCTIGDERMLVLGTKSPGSIIPWDERARTVDREIDAILDIASENLKVRS